MKCTFITRERLSLKKGTIREVGVHVKISASASYKVERSSGLFMKDRRDPVTAKDL